MYIMTAPKRITIKGYKNKDCTVNAIGNALSISYDLSRKVLQTLYIDNGVTRYRKRGPRTKAEFVRQNVVEMICEAVSVESKYPEEEVTVIQFANRNPKGRYIVLVKGHLLAVIDGKIVDTMEFSWRRFKSNYEENVKSYYSIDEVHAANVIKDIGSYYRMDTSEHIHVLNCS